MSTTTPNFFGVLGEDASASGAVHLNAIPKTVESTSSRKTDVNPKADPSKARKRAPGAPSNDKILKESKDAGRANNRRVPVKEGAASHHSRRAERSDRIPRSGKRDTARRERAGWGDENTEPADQAAGVEIAHEDHTHDGEEDVDAANASATPEERKLTLEEFQQLQREQNAGLNTRGSSSAPKPAGTPATAPITAAVPEPRKKQTTKARKEVETLSLDSSFLPPLQQQANGVVDLSARRSTPERRDRKPAGKPEPRGRKPQARSRDGKSKDSKPKDAKDSKDSKPRSKPAGKRAAGPAINIAGLPKLN